MKSGLHAIIFLLIGIYSSVEWYTVFQTEPMHIFLLEINKMFKEYLIEVVYDSQRTSFALLTTHLQSQTYEQMKKEVLRYLKQFLIDPTELGLGSVFGLDFAKQYRQYFTTGIFSEHYLLGILIDSDLESVDQVFSFQELKRQRLWIREAS